MFRTHRYLTASLLAAGVWIATPACATQTYGSRNVYGGPQVDQRAFDIGYQEGIRQGRDDARERRQYQPQRHSEYRDADDGYRRSEGDREFYRQSYRRGFDSGYSEGFNRNASAARYPYPYPPVSASPVPRYPAPGVYNSPASQVGYRDGVDAGRDDARHRNAFDPVRSSRYRSADHEYNSRYGSKDEFKREYRSAFEQGYSAGYRGY